MELKKALEIYRDFLMEWLMEFGDNKISPEQRQNNKWWTETVRNPQFRQAVQRIPHNIRRGFINNGHVTRRGKQFIKAGR